MFWVLLGALQCSPTMHTLASRALLSPKTFSSQWYQLRASLHSRLKNTHIPCFGTKAHVPCFTTSVLLPCFTSNSLIPCFLTNTHIPCFLTNTHIPCFSTNASIHEFEACDINKFHGKLSRPGEETFVTLSNLDKICNTINGNWGVGKNMESALQKCGVQISTELVEKVLDRFRSHERIAFRFFTWASHQGGYRHQHHTFNEMIDILTTTKDKSKQFGIVSDLLHQMKRCTNPKLPIETYAAVLRKYAEKHLTTVRKFANKKKGKIKADPEVNALNMLLDALCKCYLVGEAQTLYEKLKVKFKPDDKTYSVLFFGWCNIGKPVKAMEILYEMIDVGYAPDNRTYNTLLDAFCKDGQVDEALKFFKFMKTRGCIQSVPTAKTYSIQIVALAYSGRIEEALTLLGEMRNSGCIPDVATYTEIIEGFCIAGKLDEAFKVLDEMREKGYPPDIVTYNCFMKVLCRLRNVEEALRLFDRMLEAGCLPSNRTYNMLIKMFCDLGQLYMAYDLFNNMEKKGCAPDASSYCTLIKGLFDNARVEEAFSCLMNVTEKDMRLPYEAYDFFLMELSKAGELRKIQWLSGQMRKFYHYRISRRFQKSQRWRKGERRRR